MAHISFSMHREGFQRIKTSVQIGKRFANALQRWFQQDDTNKKPYQGLFETLIQVQKRRNKH